MRHLAERDVIEVITGTGEDAVRVRAVDNISDALMTPLTAVLGIARTLEMVELPAEVRKELTNRLRVRVEELDDRIHDLLQMVLGQARERDTRRHGMGSNVLIQ